MTMYDDKRVFERTFNWDITPEYLKQAQWAEFILLKEVIAELSKKLGRPIKILDIGVGDGRILKHLIPINEIWSQIETYDAIDNTDKCIQTTSEVIKENKVGEKVRAHLLDGVELDSLGQTYDLIITTWFTTGNIFPDDFPFDSYDKSSRLDLTQNEKFTKIFTKAYDMLDSGGALLFGSAYKENDKTREKQEEAYLHYNMTVITDEQDDFTATKEGFWSQRFSPERMERYLNSIPKNNFEYIDLDTYDFAMAIKVNKK